MKAQPKTRVRTRTTVTSKGQITIPISIRRTGVGVAGAQFDCKEEGGEIRLIPVAKENPFLKYAGIERRGKGRTRKELVQWFREWRGHDEYDRY